VRVLSCGSATIRRVAKNRLYYSDTIDVVRRYIADESVDLICLDPPLNDEQSQAQIHAFEDTLHWTYVTR
jgi:hypothetical protein